MTCVAELPDSVSMGTHHHQSRGQTNSRVRTQDTLRATASYLTDFSSRQPKARKRPINAQHKRSKTALPASSSGVLSASDRPLDGSAMLALSVLLEEMVRDASQKYPMSRGEEEEAGQLVPGSERETDMVHLPDRL